MSREITEELLKQCLIDFKEGMSLTKIGEKHSINRKSLSKKLKKTYGVSPLKDGKIPMDSSFFEVIDTTGKAYWLGFLYADGYVSSNRNTIELGLSKVDEEHVVLFKNTIKCLTALSYKSVNNPSGTVSEVVRLSFRDKQMKSNLIEHGCGPQKSHELKLPDLKDELMSHFLRGYFDGDGCILLSNRNTINITSGCINMLKQIQLYLKDRLNVTTVIYQDNRSESTYRLQCNRQFESLHILNFLYNNSTVTTRLKRKYEKYQLFICRLETKLQKSQDN